MGITVEIDGLGRVELDDSFGTMSPQKQSAIIQDIINKASQPDPRQAMRDRIAAAKAGTLTVSPESASRAAAADQVAQDNITLSTVGPVLSRVTKFNQGIPFVGEYFDEAVGKVYGPEVGQLARDVQGAFGRQNPNESLGLQLAGGIAGSAGVGGLAATGAKALGLSAPIAAAVPTSTMGRVATGGVLGALAGGAEGAVSGYGAGEGDSRMVSAQERGLLGFGMGGLLGAAAPFIANGIKGAVARFKGQDVRTIAKTFNVSPEAATALKAAIEADDLTAAQDVLRRAGPDAMLADAGGGFAQMLDTSMQSGGAAARIGREAVDSRAIAADARMTDALDNALGSPMGVNTARAAIKDATSGARSAAYDAAYAAPINYADPLGQKLLGLTNRIPGSAIDYANKLMRANGEQSRQILADIADDGTVTFKRLPDVRQWDYIKRALDAEAQKGDGLGLLGGQTPLGSAYAGLAKEVRNTVAELVPEYGQALSVASDAITQSKGVEFGSKLLQRGTTRETVADFLDGATAPEVAAIRQGMRSQIDEALANIKANITNPDANINELVTLWKDLSSRANREKVTMVLGRSEADRLFAALDEAGIQLQTRASVARNSATASRQAGQRVVQQSTQPGAGAALAELKPIEAARRVFQTLTGNTPQARLAQEQQIYKEIAQILTAKRGPEAEDALRIVQRAIAGQPSSTAEAARVARAVTTGGLLGGYQAGSQYQASQRYVTGPQ